MEEHSKRKCHKKHKCWVAGIGFFHKHSFVHRNGNYKPNIWSQDNTTEKKGDAKSSLGDELHRLVEKFSFENCQPNGRKLHNEIQENSWLFDGENFLNGTEKSKWNWKSVKNWEEYR